MLLLMWIMAIAEVQRGRSAVARKVNRLAEIGAMQIHPRDYAKVAKYWTNGQIKAVTAFKVGQMKGNCCTFPHRPSKKKMKREKRQKSESVDQLRFYYDFGHYFCSVLIIMEMVYVWIFIETVVAFAVLMT